MHSHLAELLCTVPKHDCLSSPVPHRPALTSLHLVAWSRHNGEPLLIPLWHILYRFGHRDPLIFLDLLTNAMWCDMHHYASGPDCATMLAPVHEQLYHFGAHFFSCVTAKVITEFDLTLVTSTGLWTTCLGTVQIA